jgi:septum formation protein
VALVVRRAEEQEPVHLEFSETTKVCFAPVGGAEIAAYIETGDCWGKAGSYGIQRAAGAWVEWIEGCYFNVMGFPIHKFAKSMSDMISDGRLPLP